MSNLLLPHYQSSLTPLQHCTLQASHGIPSLYYNSMVLLLYHLHLIICTVVSSTLFHCQKNNLRNSYSYNFIPFREKSSHGTLSISVECNEPLNGISFGYTCIPIVTCDIFLSRAIYSTHDGGRLEAASSPSKLAAAIEGK